MSILDGLGSLADAGPVIDWFIAPWRYLLSSGYRKHKHDEWQRARARQAVDVLAGVSGFVLGIAALWFGLHILIR